MRRAIQAQRSGGTPESADVLPCRFSGEGLAPTDDGWGSFQMDGPALWLWALREHLASARGGGRPVDDAGSSLGLAEPEIPHAVLRERDVLRAAAVVAEYVAALWSRPSFDAWEEHGDRIATSTLAACLAGLLAAHRLGLEPAGASDVVAAIRAELAVRGRRTGFLPRSDADGSVDASVLWCASLLGAVHPASPTWQETLAHIESRLVGPEGGVHRYIADEFYGGGQWPVLAAAHGLACLQRGADGDLERARRAMGWIEAQRGPSGELPEQSSTQLLHPDLLATWQRRWGPVASPLSWSHAMAVLLRRALLEAGAA